MIADAYGAAADHGTVSGSLDGNVIVGGWTMRSCAAAGVAGARNSAKADDARTTTARAERDVVVTASSACTSSSACRCRSDASRRWRRAGSALPVRTPDPSTCPPSAASFGSAFPATKPAPVAVHVMFDAGSVSTPTEDHRLPAPTAAPCIERRPSLDRDDERPRRAGHLRDRIGIAVGEADAGARERQARETVDGTFSVAVRLWPTRCEPVTPAPVPAGRRRGVCESDRRRHCAREPSLPR